MHVLLWSVCGGSGVTVTTALLAVDLERKGGEVSLYGGEDLALVLEPVGLEVEPISQVGTKSPGLGLVDGSELSVEERDTARSAADRSLLVLPLSLLPLARAARVAAHVDGIVAVDVQGSVVTQRDFEDILHAPVVATVARDQWVADAVDRGRADLGGERALRLVDGLSTYVRAMWK